MNDIDLVEIFATMKPEQDRKRQDLLEQRKVRIITQKIVEHVKKHGAVWHIGELTESLKDRAKLSVLNLCLGEISDPNVRVKFVGDLLRVTEISCRKKNIIVKECKNQNLLTGEDERRIRTQLLADKARRERI